MLWVVLVGSLLLWAGCASSGETDEDESPADRVEPLTEVDKGLATPSDEVGVVQLYRSGDERRLPVLPLQGSDAHLTLRFDLLEARGRPLSIHFYHADREWERRLSPSEFMSGFQRDNLLDYTQSQGTEVPYAHYSYHFPNDDIQFRVSGNYVLRVTEQRDRDDVLFEKPFYVTEGGGQISTEVENVRLSGQRRPSLLPRTVFTPPSDLRGDPQRYELCVVRNGRFDQVRCQDRPRLTRQPELEFDLQRREAFAPSTADYFLDLSALQSGGAIERVDRSRSPYRVLLAPDYARFSGRQQGMPLDGQVLIDRVVRDVGTPHTQAEYVETHFSFVPPEGERLDSDPAVTGPFKGGGDGSHDLNWDEDRDRYEGTALLKQGQYEYFYSSTDPNLATRMQRNAPRAQDRFTAFVYYDDPSLNTDRLVALDQVEVRP